MGILIKNILQCPSSLLTNLETPRTRLRVSETCQLLLTSTTVRVPLQTLLSPRLVLSPLMQLEMPELPTLVKTSRNVESPLNQLVCPCTSKPTSRNPTKMRNSGTSSI